MIESSTSSKYMMSQKGSPKMLLKVDCLPNAVVKQPSIPLILSWKKMDVKLMMMMMTKDLFDFVFICYEM